METSQNLTSVVRYLIFVAFLEAVVLCLVFSFRFISVGSTITLLVFDFLFVSLIFQLNGSWNRKFLLLTLGNMVGLFWNFVFSLFSVAGMAVFGEMFGVFYSVIFPFLNLLWIVSFWSLSLSALSPPLCSVEVES
jgi:hypothetical protein